MLIHEGVVVGDAVEEEQVTVCPASDAGVESEGVGIDLGSVDGLPSWALFV
jgi:hypothetical protein